MFASVRSGETNRNWPVALVGTAALASLLLAAQPAAARGWGPCSQTALAGLLACKSDVRDELYETLGNCVNVSEEEERGECRDEARKEHAEARQLCREQFGARRELCEELGQERYDPVFDPEDFDTDFHNPMNPNPYWPLGIGDTWVYQGGDETVTIQVLDETKLIEGVTCVVVQDRAEEEGKVKEDTFDWHALAKDGAVHYCGEISSEFEHFEGDDPEEPELIGTEGSWKAGRDGAKSGILMQAAPQVGQVYRQEWAFLEAEDAARVLSTAYGYGDDEELDEHVPEDLAELLCDDDCVVTRDFTPIEPDVSERKYYAPGIGLFLEVNGETGETLQLVNCSLDPVCASLPEAADGDED